MARENMFWARPRLGYLAYWGSEPIIAMRWVVAEEMDCQPKWAKLFCSTRESYYEFRPSLRALSNGDGHVVLSKYNECRLGNIATPAMVWCLVNCHSW